MGNYAGYSWLCIISSDLLILQLSDAAMAEDPGLAVTLPLLTTGRPYDIVEQ
jgi:hypothetical protein